MKISPCFFVGPLSEFQPGTPVHSETGDFGLVILDPLDVKILAVYGDGRFKIRPPLADEEFVGVTDSVDLVLDWSQALVRAAPGNGSGVTLFLYESKPHIVVSPRDARQWKLLSLDDAKLRPQRFQTTFAFQHWQLCLAGPGGAQRVLHQFTCD